MGELRAPYYANKANDYLPVVKEIIDECQRHYGKPFLFSGVSKIGAFYLNEDYAQEHEVRFLVKRTSDEYPAHDLEIVETGPPNEGYVTLPFISRFAKFKVISIQPGPTCSDTAIEQITNVIRQHHPDATVLPRA